MGKKLVHGVGVYEKGVYPASLNRELTLHYKIWVGMLQRCYSEANQKKRPTYIGCSVSEDFKNFQLFAAWCELQIGFGVKGYHLDKDIISKGSKQYSADNCVFIPKHINLLLTDRGRDRGEYPIGVNWHKAVGKFQASLSRKGKRHCIGYYNSVEDAVSAYKEAKESHVKDMAREYKDFVDERVYNALMVWETTNALINKQEETTV